MGYIKEPVGVDLEVGPMPLLAEDRQAISEIIDRYKKTGEMPTVLSKSKLVGKTKSSNKAGAKRTRTTLHGKRMDAR